MLPTGGRRSSDRRLFRRQSRHCSIKETICVYLRDLWANCDGWAALCLRAFVFAMSSVILSVFSVPLWFIAWVGELPVGLQIHLRVHGVKRHRRFELGERNLVVDGVRVKLIGRTEADGRDAENARSGASVGRKG